MLLRTRSHLTLTNVGVLIALIFAMSSGAYAAKRYLITSTKQISPGVLKALKGKAGERGLAGPQGAPGTPGKDGTNGTNGKDGAAGESVSVRAIATEESTCAKQGGSEFTVSGKTARACNGLTGYTETLPSGKTLRGTWALEAILPGTGALQGSAATGISFGITLAQPATIVYIRPPTEEEEEKGEFPPDPSGCTGNYTEPGAEKGHLCVFARAEANTSGPKICSGLTSVIACIFSGTTPASSRDGFIVTALDTAAGLMFLNGTWAVTAE